MIGLLRAAVLAFVLLSVVYVIVSIYSRSVRREKLEKDWDSDPEKLGAESSERDAYIKAGLNAYRHSLRRKLIVLVYIIPMAVVLATAYAVNHQ
jgi:Ca2+/Na+ antiporter